MQYSLGNHTRTFHLGRFPRKLQLLVYDYPRLP
nr:MAG TPA: hypothetical protein [Caudoviricetes sp.]